MLEIVGILYKELHYRRLKNNPQIASDPKKLAKQLKTSGDLVKGVIFQSAVLLLFGFMIGMAVNSTNDEFKAVVVFSTYAMLPFVMALYTTAVNASYATSMCIFEPLKPLPIKTGAKYLSLLLMVDNVPALVAMLPAVAFLTLSYGIVGFLGLLWVVVGAFLGHTLGLVIFSLFGLRTSIGGRFSGLKTLARAIGILLFIGMFYAINYLQAYVSEHYEELAGLFSRYAIAYPFSVTSILEPPTSVLMLLCYVAVLVPVYLAVIGKLWEGMGEGRIVSQGGSTVFKAKTLLPAVAIAVKDFKIVFRKSALLVGLILPIFIVLPTALSVLSEGGTSEHAIMPVLFMIAWMGSIGVDTVLKIDGLAFEVLQSLPITPSQFVRGKLITMNAVPVSAGFLLVAMAAYLKPSLVRLLPAAVVLPLMTSSLAMLYFYRGEKELSLPETNVGDVIVLMILNGIALGTVSVVWFLFGYWYTLALALAGVVVFLKAVST